ncbi:MAG: carbohydrate kinase family protein [Chloroflexi bacterium]|nr:carbohydrate kinase family protein [Chloroflexota bacterium]
MDAPEVIVVGAACVDIKGKALGQMIDATSNPGKIKLSAGGAARNIAENLARLGVSAALLTVVGSDPFGHAILERSKVSGLDLSGVLVVEGARSAAYLALLDQDGEMLLSIDDMGIAGAMTPEYIESYRGLFRRAKMVVVDANISSRTMTTVFALARRYRVPVCVNPVSVALAHKVKPRLKYCTIITPNAAEAQVLTGQAVANEQQAARAAQRLLAAGVEIAIITRGEEGLTYAHSDGAGNVPAVRCEVADSTGASDALTAAVVYGLVNGFSVDEAVRLGVSAASIALMSTDTVNPDMSLEYLYETLRI